MSNFYEFGTGNIVVRGIPGSDGAHGVVFSYVPKPMEMDVDLPIDSDGEVIPLHSTVFVFPTKESLERLICMFQAHSARAFGDEGEV